MAQPPHIMVNYEAEEGWEKGWAVTLKDSPLVKHYRLSLPEAPQLCHQPRNKYSKQDLVGDCSDANCSKDTDVGGRRVREILCVYSAWAGRPGQS